MRATPTFVDDATYPVNYSAGGINAYYVSGCESAGHRPGYCICVNKIQAHHRDGGLSDSSCDVPIRNGICIALAMRKRELAEGKSIYFIHRDKLNAFNDAQRVNAIPATSKDAKKRPMVYPAYVVAQQALTTPGGGQPDDVRPDFIRTAKADPSKSIPLRKSSVIDTIDTGTYASAINAEVEKAEKPAIKTEAVLGESPLQMARRLMGKS